MSKLIEQTPDYDLIVGSSPEHDGRACYQVVNRVTDVVEAETQILPQGYEYLEQIQAGLDVKRQALEDQKEAAARNEGQIVHGTFNH